MSAKEGGGAGGHIDTVDSGLQRQQGEGEQGEGLQGVGGWQRRGQGERTAKCVHV